MPKGFDASGSIHGREAVGVVAAEWRLISRGTDECLLGGIHDLSLGEAGSEAHFVREYVLLVEFEAIDAVSEWTGERRGATLGEVAGFKGAWDRASLRTTTRVRCSFLRASRAET